ncbi:MAG TPA: hypothetical protein PLI05_05695 [Methanotrichaceae archaeon]|nr:hypothetical protein [Methanotrichaceae archaeon]HQF16543.1 hypothetical protein [Methanotrichaceae archaeon]HQI91086.1 hypothetical protein [Methanotrichaceae archaeon]HQJ28523.1 hypothetical protein [Methanotrichaceae archaeon]
MRSLLSVISVIGLALVCLAGNGTAAEEKALAYDITPLIGDAPAFYVYADDEGNLSEVNCTDMMTLRFLTSAQTVKFTPPKAGWKLQKVQIAGWAVFDVQNETIPGQAITVLEVRDKDLNLLYQTSQVQVDYFDFRLPFLSEIEVPALAVNGDFYVSFYGRKSVAVAFNQTGSAGNSFIYDRVTGELVPAEVFNQDNTTSPLNWVIRAFGN